ncbi:hypothetical protein [Luteolibacter luteus]|uniref:Uncharacterized protein n=1 Tax=Luteolibacter luteus TaxID=2728835 RepID=A0A858RJ95_9BACT|nr:hypothetical protein [Luteolibacter luteus]QJE97326.1 hypothetical protein HHL09_16530 [Luteolibacter luteus]
MKVMRILVVVIFLPVAFAEELPGEVEEVRSDAIEVVENAESEGQDFLLLVGKLAKAGEYDFLGTLLQKATENGKFQFSEILVMKVLEAPAGTEFKPDLAEALIEYVDSALRRSNLRDEIVTGLRIVSQRIAVVLENGLDIPSSEFDYEQPPVALRYIDDAKQAIARLRRDGGVCRITPEVAGGNSHQLARELIIERDEVRASGGQREERRGPPMRDRVRPVKENGGKEVREESPVGTKWGIGFGVAILGVLAAFFVWRGRR